MLVNGKTLFLAVAFLAGSAFAAGAQTGSGTSSPGASGNVSAATHCLDQATGQPKLKTAAGAGGSSLAGSTAGSASGSGSSSTGSTSGSGSPGGMSGGSAAANLPKC